MKTKVEAIIHSSLGKYYVTDASSIQFNATKNLVAFTGFRADSQDQGLFDEPHLVNLRGELAIDVLNTPQWIFTRWPASHPDDLDITETHE